MQHFVFAVVEAERVPSRMFATCAVMEILIRGTIEITKTLQLVLHSVRVNEIHDDLDASSVRIIDERFEFVRRTETAGSCEEIRYMVSERTVIGVLLDSHDLDAVIA